MHNQHPQRSQRPPIFVTRIMLRILFALFVSFLVALAFFGTNALSH
ncbi:hypothetical protein [Tengunoibacter tsumagoiensis]|nr:hypothetical protein [Tengunoibacter tsumagoiensis]